VIGRRPSGFFLKRVGDQKARCVPDRRGLGQPLVTARHVVPARADQIELQGFDQLLADLGGGGHTDIVARASPKRPALLTQTGGPGPTFTNAALKQIFSGKQIFHFH